MSQSSSESMIMNPVTGERAKSVDAAVERRHAEPHRKEELQQQRQPERGDGQPGDADDPQDVVEQRIALERRYHAERNAERDRQRDRHQGQLQGGRQALCQVLRYRPLAVDADAEIARHDVAEVPHELHPERLVVAELDAHRLDLRRRGVLAQENAHRIGGNDVGDQEDDDDQPGQRRHEPGQSRQDHL